MMNFRYRHNADIRFGNGIISEAHELIKKLGFTKPAIIVDQGVLLNNEKIQKFIEKKDKVFVHEQQEPSYDYLEKFKSQLDNQSFDCLIAIGGGSTMDLAKGLAVLATNPGLAINYKGFPSLTNKPVPVITIPTLPGTGSEIAYNAVFTDTATKTRLGINTELNYPVLCIIDPELAISAPKKVLIASTMDCLCHTVSSFISPGASPLTKALAKQAFLELVDGIPLLCHESTHLKALNHLYLASIMANMSLNNAGCGLEGAFSYPLGAHYGVPHGIGEGIFLPYLVNFYVKQGFRGYEELYDLVTVTKNTTPLIKNERFVEFINKLYHQLGAPENLYEYSITRADIPFITDHVKKCFNEVPPPVTFSVPDCKKMLEQHITEA